MGELIVGCRLCITQAGGRRIACDLKWMIGSMYRALRPNRMISRGSLERVAGP